MVKKKEVLIRRQETLRNFSKSHRKQNIPKGGYRLSRESPFRRLS